jgi:hypothetical protein
MGNPNLGNGEPLPPKEYEVVRAKATNSPQMPFKDFNCDIAVKGCSGIPFIAMRDYGWGRIQIIQIGNKRSIAESISFHDVR